MYQAERSAPFGGISLTTPAASASDMTGPVSLGTLKQPSRGDIRHAGSQYHQNAEAHPNLHAHRRRRLDGSRRRPAGQQARSSHRDVRHRRRTLERNRRRACGLAPADEKPRAGNRARCLARVEPRRALQSGLRARHAARGPARFDASGRARRFGGARTRDRSSAARPSSAGKLHLLPAVRRRARNFTSRARSAVAPSASSSRSSRKAKAFRPMRCGISTGSPTHSSSGHAGSMTRLASPNISGIPQAGRRRPER